MNQLLAMRIFVRVVETRSFSKTAEQLALPRSTASKLVTDLEVHLATQLLHRTTRSVSVTAEGLEYYNQIVKLLGEIDETDNAARHKRLIPSGRLCIDAPASFALHLLIPALPEFQQRYPDIEICLGISDRTIDIVGEGVDCVIRAGQIHDQSMVARKITEFGYVTCASRGYINANGTPLHPDDIGAEHTSVGYFFGASGRYEPMLFNNGSERITIEKFSYSTNEGNGLSAMMRAGIGIGQHMRPFLQPWIDAGELVEVLPDWTRPPTPFHAIYPPGRHQSARLKVFLDWLIARFADDTRYASIPFSFASR